MECKVLTVQAGGRPLPNASVTVQTPGVSNPLPTVYAPGSSATPSGTLDNPMTTDANGEVQFAMPDGAYDIVISGAGIGTQTLYRQMFWDETTASTAPFSQVSLAMPSPLTVTGSPAGASGTLTVTWTTGQTAARVLATDPTASSAVSLRALAKEHLPTSGVSAAIYGSATQIPVITFDAYGRATSVTNTTATPAWSDVSSKPTTVEGFGITDGVKVQFAQTTVTTLSNSTTETSLIGAGQGSKTLSAGDLVAGTTIKIRLGGHYTDTLTASFTTKVKIGGTTVLSSTDQPNAVTSKAWWLEVTLTCLTTGVSGTIDGGGFGGFLGGSTFQAIDDLILSGPVSIDTTAALAIDVTGTWSSAGANATLTNRYATIEIMRGA